MTSALVRHDLTDQIPGSIHVALKRSQRQPRTKVPVTWHRFAEATFDIGREQVEVASGYTLVLYGPMRSIIEAFRVGHLEGRDVPIGALRRWLRQRGHHPADLLDMAKHFPKTTKSIRARLSLTSQVPLFVLKGGALLAAFDARRPTRDIDLAVSRIANDTEIVRRSIMTVLEVEHDDGLGFRPSEARADVIRDGEECSGVRVLLPCTLATAKLDFHVDVNVGDPILSGKVSSGEWSPDRKAWGA